MNVLAVSIDSGLLQRALHQLHDSDSGGQDAVPAPLSSDPEGSDPAASEKAAEADEPTACRNVKMQVAVDCGHVGLSVSGTQLATVTWVHLEVTMQSLLAAHLSIGVIYAQLYVGVHHMYKCLLVLCMHDYLLVHHMHDCPSVYTTCMIVDRCALHV